jgi:hypothetical protein
MSKITESSVRKMMRSPIYDPNVMRMVLLCAKVPIPTTRANPHVESPSNTDISSEKKLKAQKALKRDVKTRLREIELAMNKQVVTSSDAWD